MTIEIIQPSSRAEWLDLRKPTSGASETPAILGVDRWSTPYEQWALKSGLYEPPQPEAKILENSLHLPPTERGNIVEPIGCVLLRRLRPSWTVEPNVIGGGGKLFRDLDAGLSCTPDAFVTNPARDGRAPFQIKNPSASVFRDEWLDDQGDVHVPPWVAIQNIQEGWLTGSSWGGYVGAIVIDRGIEFHLIEVKLHSGIIARIKREVADFWRRVRENDPPDPDYARDGDVIKSLYADDDDATIDLSGNERVLKLIARRTAMKEIESAATEAEKERKTIDAELIHALGNATRGVLADGRVIEAKTIRRKGFTVEPTSYRSIKVKQRKVA